MLILLLVFSNAYTITIQEFGLNITNGTVTKQIFNREKNNTGEISAYDEEDIQFEIFDCNIQKGITTSFIKAINSTWFDEVGPITISGRFESFKFSFSKKVKADVSYLGDRNWRIDVYTSKYTYNLFYKIDHDHYNEIFQEKRLLLNDLFE
ncbi:hypothetical protein pb186bvf_009536 [Paramecium bursaria]